MVLIIGDENRRDCFSIVLEVSTFHSHLPLSFNSLLGRITESVLAGRGLELIMSLEEHFQINGLSFSAYD